MKTALEILNRVEPNGELLNTDTAIKAMKEYAMQFLGQTFTRECNFCKNNKERLNTIYFPNYPECCKECYPVPNQYYKFELP